MGKKKSTSSKNKRKNKNHSNKVKYKTRREFLLSGFSDWVLDLWFGDDEKARNEFGDYLISRDEKNQKNAMDELLDGYNPYEEKINKLRKSIKKCKDLDEITVVLMKIEELEKKAKKNKKKYKKIKNKDLGIASYLNSSRYSKKYLNKDKYRKHLEDIAKNEEREIKEMRKLGYIKNKDVDKELKKIEKANKNMEYALSDAYTQKHFL